MKERECEDSRLAAPIGEHKGTCISMTLLAVTWKVPERLDKLKNLEAGAGRWRFHSSRPSKLAQSPIPAHIPDDL